MINFFELFVEKKLEVFNLFIEHMNMTTLAVVISILIGIPIGIILIRNKVVARLVIAIANLMQSIPCIALLAFLIPFIGIGKVPAIIMVVVYALLPIIKNTYTGIYSIDPKTIESAKGIGFSKVQILFKVQLPIAAPFIMAGIRISAVTAVGSMTIAAFAGAGGLGWFIAQGMQSLNNGLVLLGAIPASILALLIDFILSAVERVVSPEGLKAPELIKQITKRRRLVYKSAVLALCAIFVSIPVVSSAAEYIGKSEKKIVIGSSNFTEAITLGNIYSELIRKNTDIEVEEQFNLNGAAFSFTALENGEIDSFVEYTGTALANILHEPMINNPDEVYNKVKTMMKDEHKIVTSEPLGFNNTYVMSVKSETAEKYNLSKLSDLLNISDKLKLGCTVEFINREDCLPGLKEKYGVSFKEISGLDGSLRYQAVDSEKVDVIDAFSTDGLLEKLKLTTLEDDMSFFPPFHAVAFTREEAFDEYPELKTLFSKLDGLITEEKMRNMNYEVDVEGKTSKEVAHKFLIENNLIQE